MTEQSGGEVGGGGDDVWKSHSDAFQDERKQEGLGRRTSLVKSFPRGAKSRYGTQFQPLIEGN